MVMCGSSKQWKLDGDCNKCERKTLCMKVCKPAREKQKQAIINYLERLENEN